MQKFTRCTIMKHSMDTYMTLYHQDQKFNPVKLTRKALEIILKNHVLVIDKPWQSKMRDGAIYFKIAPKL